MDRVASELDRRRLRSWEVCAKALLASCVLLAGLLVAVMFDGSVTRDRLEHERSLFTNSAFWAVMKKYQQNQKDQQEWNKRQTDINLRVLDLIEGLSNGRGARGSSGARGERLGVDLGSN